MTQTNDRSSTTAAAPEPRPDTLHVSEAVRKSIVVTCASMATLVLATGYQAWRMRQLLHAFTDGDVPLLLRVMLIVVGLIMSITVIGMLGYGLAALPVLAKGRQRAIERLLQAQGWLWSLIGATMLGLLALGVVARILNFLGDLWPF